VHHQQVVHLIIVRTESRGHINTPRSKHTNPDRLTGGASVFIRDCYSVPVVDGRMNEQFVAQTAVGTHKSSFHRLLQVYAGKPEAPVTMDWMNRLSPSVRVVSAGSDTCRGGGCDRLPLPEMVQPLASVALNWYVPAPSARKLPPGVNGPLLMLNAHGEVPPARKVQICHFYRRNRRDPPRLLSIVALAAPRWFFLK
jgi:hypothetical protein